VTRRRQGYGGQGSEEGSKARKAGKDESRASEVRTSEDRRQKREGRPLFYAFLSGWPAGSVQGKEGEKERPPIADLRSGPSARKEEHFAPVE
jgi:hypothetical protein